MSGIRLGGFLGTVILRHCPNAKAFLALIVVRRSHTRAFEAEDPVRLAMRAVPRGHKVATQYSPAGADAHRQERPQGRQWASKGKEE